MDLRALRSVIAIAERLSFTVAARDLNVSQPALSQQIRGLEDELGLQIFARTPHRVTVTRGGELVVAHARRTIEGATRLREAVDAFRGLQRGKLRMAVTQSFNALHLPSALAAFLDRYPAIDVTVLEWANPAIVAGVLDGTLDLGVAFGPIDAALSLPLLYEDRLMLACPAGHAFADRTRTPLSALSTETLAVLIPDFGTRRTVDDFLATQGVKPLRIIEVDRFASILQLVAMGACVSIMPGWSTDGEPRDGVAFRAIDPPPPPRPIHLVLPPHAARSPAAAAMADIMLGRFR